jgi:hypothetical protein
MAHHLADLTRSSAGVTIVHGTTEGPLRYDASQPIPFGQALGIDLDRQSDSQKIATQTLL